MTKVCYVEEHVGVYLIHNSYNFIYLYKNKCSLNLIIKGIDQLEVNISYKIHDIYKKIYIISIIVYNSYKQYYKLSR